MRSYFLFSAEKSGLQQNNLRKPFLFNPPRFYLRGFVFSILFVGFFKH